MIKALKQCVLFFLFGLLFQAFVPLSWAEPVQQSSPALSRPAAVEPGESSYSDRITLDFKDADINTVLRVLSLKSHVNIVAGPEVQGTVTIRLENVPWEKALDVVLRTYNYVYERDGNIIRITTREKMAQEPVVTQTYILNYTRAVEVQDSVKDMLTERGRIRIAERTNTLIITDIPTNLYRIKEVIKRLDQRTPQAFIDSKVVKTAAGVVENMGVAWTPAMSVSGSSRPTTFPFSMSTKRGNPGERVGSFLERYFPINAAGDTTLINPNDSNTFPLPGISDVTNSTYSFGTLSFTNFTAVLSHLKSRGDTKVVSNPRIVVLNNQKAKVQVGEQIPLPNYERNETTGSVEITGFSYRDVGVILNVTPHINSEEEILVELAPEVSATGQTIDFGDFQVPSFDVTVATTQVLIRSGETIAIGGLMTDSTQKAEAKVPGLGDVPLVGKLFRSKRQTEGSGNEKVETLFFITVTTVDTEGQPTGDRIKERKKKKIGGIQALTESSKDMQTQAEPAVTADAGPVEEEKVEEPQEKQPEPKQASPAASVTTQVVDWSEKPKAPEAQPATAQS